jgi:hypothetical protein
MDTLAVQISGEPGKPFTAPVDLATAATDRTGAAPRPARPATPTSASATPPTAAEDLKGGLLCEVGPAGYGTRSCPPMGQDCGSTVPAPH